MDGLNFNQDINAGDAEFDIDLNAMPKSSSVTVLNSVASEVVDLFVNKEEAEKYVNIGNGNKLPVGEFVVTVLKENKLDNLITMFGMILSQRAALKDTSFTDTDAYEYVNKAARVKVVGVTEVDLTNAGPASVVSYIGNGAVVMCLDSLCSTVFSGSFLLGNLLADPIPYSGTTSKKFKTLAAVDIITIKAFDKEFKIPTATMKHLWYIISGRDRGKGASASVSNIPWVIDGEKPVVISKALSNIFTNLLNSCGNLKSDEIEFEKVKISAWKFVAAWFTQRLCNRESDVYQHWIAIAHGLNKFEWVINVTDKEMNYLPITGSFAGKYLEGCRGVRGRDNPNLEYCTWTILDNIPWGFVGTLRHRMMCEGAGIKIGCVVKDSSVDNGFVTAKTVSGLVKGWEESVKATKGAIFTYGENLVSSAYFQAPVTRTPDLDAVSPLWLLYYVCGITQGMRLVASRFQLPTTAGSYDKFLELSKMLLANGELVLVPGLTPHNLEAYLIYVPGKKGTIDGFKENVLKRMYHMYKASILCNFGRTVSYCLMIPGNLGKAMFYPATMKNWQSWILSSYKGSFAIDEMNTTPVYKRVTLDDQMVADLMPLDSDLESVFGELKKRKIVSD